MAKKGFRTKNTQNAQDNPQALKKTYFVKGMHCASCEVLIEKTLKERKGIENVKPSLMNHKVEIWAESAKDFPSTQELNQSFKDLGYTFFEKNPNQQDFSQNDKSTLPKALILVGLLFFGFLIIERSGLLIKYTITTESSLPAFFILGLLAGISSCAALIGALLLSLSKQWNNIYNGNVKKSKIPFIMFNAGRLVSFAILGGLLGLAGSFIKFSIQSTAILTITISAIMIVLGLQLFNVKWAKRLQIKAPRFLTGKIADETNFKGKHMPFLVGAATFLLPCGFTLIAQTNALATGNFITSSLMMLAFALGTLPVLALISFSSIKLYQNVRFSSIFGHTAGLLVVLFALYNINSQLNVLGLGSLSDIGGKVFAKKESTQNVQLSNAYFADGFQVIQLEASTFDYYPNYIEIKSGLPTRLEIINTGAAGCANVVSAYGLYPNLIPLQAGENAVEFVAPEPGTYKITCSMGMVDPVTVKVI